MQVIAALSVSADELRFGKAFALLGLEIQYAAFFVKIGVDSFWKEAFVEFF